MHPSLVLRLHEHISEVIVLRETIHGGIVEPEIAGDQSSAVAPESRDEIYPLRDPMMFSAPVVGYVIHLLRIRFVEGRIVDYQYSARGIDQSACFIPQRLGVWRQPLQKASKAVMSWWDCDRSIITV